LQVFHDLAYYSESREDILHAINEFLDDTVVLPPGEWDRQLLTPLLMKQSKVMAKRRKEAKQISGKTNNKLDPIIYLYFFVCGYGLIVDLIMW
jgi:hypothetical protein